VYVFTIIANILLCLIFILKKDINVLHKISVIGVLAIIFSIFVIALTMITGF
jgi:amino acid permease